MNIPEKGAAGARLAGAAGTFCSDSDPVPSPCTRVCRISPVTGWCEGCLRRLEEIGGWSAMGNAERRAVWARIAERRATLEKKP